MGRLPGEPCQRLELAGDPAKALLANPEHALVQVGRVFTDLTVCRPSISIVACTLCRAKRVLRKAESISTSTATWPRRKRTRLPGFSDNVNGYAGSLPGDGNSPQGCVVGETSSPGDRQDRRW
jgi:hypothetical protein